MTGDVRGATIRRSHRTIRRGIGLGLILAVWCQAHGTQAQPVGSPASLLKEGQWVFGLNSGVLQRKIGSRHAKATFFEGGHFRGYGFSDRLSLFVEVGGGGSTFKDPNFTGPGNSDKFGGNVLLSLQVKRKLWENAGRDWEWDGSLQYTFIGTPHKQRRNQGLWYDGQMATSIAKSFGRCKPYLGVKVPFDTFQFRRHLPSGTQTGQERWQAAVGPFLGTDVYFGENQSIVVNLETAYVKGPEVNLSLGYRF